jgi:hypothetical protein
MAWVRRLGKTVVAVAVLVAAPVSGDSRAEWPPFLTPRDSWPPLVVAAVDRVWLDPTLVRKVTGPTAHAPYAFYLLLVDAPDVTALAARHLKLVRYEVEPVGEDAYHATDNNGSSGTYRVLARADGRRVILSWGEHSGSILGTVRGSALTVIDFTPEPDGVGQALTAYIKIDNVVAARLARMLVPVFGFIADRKLAEGFSVTARVAQWAVSEPREFCDWLASESLPAGRREPVRSAACH